jgi:hypothetical protein
MSMLLLMSWIIKYRRDNNKKLEKFLKMKVLIKDLFRNIVYIEEINRKYKRNKLIIGLKLILYMINHNNRNFSKIYKVFFY